MNDLSLMILAETADDAVAVERLHERTFGPGRLAKTALEKMSKVDILVNNAGTNTPQITEQIRDEDWDRVMEINLNSVMALTRALVPQM